MKFSALKGMPVVSMGDSTKVGAVREVLVDTTDLRVVSLLLSGDQGEALLPFAAIRSIGADAVTVDSVAVTEGTTGQLASERVRSIRELSALQVVNGEGTYLGDVQDVDFSPQDGRVSELVAHRGGVLGLGGSDLRVPVAAIRAVGPKILTVDLPTPPA